MAPRAITSFSGFPPLGVTDRAESLRNFIENDRIIDGGRHFPFLVVGDLLDRPAQDLAGTRLGQPLDHRGGSE